MKTVEKKFKKKGFTYELQTREGQTALYSQVNEAGRVVAYVVAIIQQNKAREIAGAHIPASESFPTGESAYGKKHFTYAPATDKAFIAAWRKFKSFRPVSDRFKNEQALKTD